MRDLALRRAANHARKFKSLTYSGQNDVVRLLLEDGEFLAVERRKVRGPASTAFIHCDHF